MAESSTPNLLIIDDDESLRNLLTIAAQSRGWRPARAADGGTGIRMLDENIKAVVLDFRLPDFEGIEVLEKLRDKRPDVPVVMLTGFNDAETAVRALRSGADDYITKPFDLDNLFQVLTDACRKRQQGLPRTELPAAAAVAQKPDGDPAASSKNALTSRNPAMRRLIHQLEKAGRLDVTILLTGESGTGKTRIAREIHVLSPRVSEPFIPVSCPALPRELLESELFGHEKGAFTGATSARAGRFEQATRGTIFLDEIGDLPGELQPKLLTVLQDREFFRVGGSKILRTEARVIAATNIDMAARVAAGTFREDLYYRLNIVELHIPALRERVEDIEDIAIAIISRIASRREEDCWQLTAEALELLKGYHWPGNIRQLENVLERATAFAEDVVLDEALVAPLLDGGPGIGNDGPESAGWKHGKLRSLKEAEYEAFMLAYKRLDGNRAKIARELGVSERTVYNLLARYDVK